MEAASNLVFPKENNSKSLLNEPHNLINDSSHMHPSRIIPEKDPNNNLALNPREKSEILSNPTVDYIRRCLLDEEDVDGQTSNCQEEALRDVEKLFYDILGEHYPSSQDNQLLSSQSKENSDCFNESLKQHSSTENMFAAHFHRGVEEGKKFLPSLKKSSIDLQVSKLSLDPMKNCDNNFRLGEEKESGFLDRSKGKKISHDADLDLLERRGRKIPIVSCEDTIRDEMFDKVLLNHGKNFVTEETSSPKSITELQANKCSEDPNLDEHIYLRDLLTSCAQAVSMNDNKIASELIKQIRKHASPIGEGNQRLACIIAEGLEARLAGTGSATYCRHVTRRMSSNDSLKAISASPILRVAYHFANESILNAVGTASKIHIVDFGIVFGFQWPYVIQALAKRKGGPPRLRITGVDLPQRGFHPDERIKDTGKRLEDYAREFEVPFEYHGIASQWASIHIEDLNIRDDEMLIANSMSNFSVLRDELFLGVNNSKNQLLNLIQAINPKVFVQGMFNLSFSPYFISRFRMVLQQYSRFFDMLDTSVPRNSKARQLMETELLGPPIINQVACEGSNLVMRPETYKQCHMRNMEIGFEQLPLDPSVVKECSEIVRNSHTEGFFIEEDCNWFLHGWKGNILYALSLWKTQDSS